MARAGDRPLKVLVVGLGSIGRRHVANLLARTDVQVAVLRRSPTDAETTKSELGVESFADRDAAAAWDPDVVIVAGPTSAHVETARWALSLPAHVLVEKPLADRTEELAALADAARHAQRIVAVAHNLRFHPALQAIRDAIHGGRIGRLLSARIEAGSYLPDWHPGEDYRVGYAARSELGGGALLTLDHELDLALWIAGPARLVAGARHRTGTLELDVDDLAEVVLAHDGGTLTSVHVDFVDRAYNRRSRWVGEHGTIEWAWGGPVALLGAAEPETLWSDPSFALDDTYRAELDWFLSGVEAGTLDGGFDVARSAVEIAVSVPFA
jgi:predicted dehydrogenase